MNPRLDEVTSWTWHLKESVGLARELHKGRSARKSFAVWTLNSKVRKVLVEDDASSTPQSLWHKRF